MSKRKMRTCLYCDDVFPSEGPQHRICPVCIVDPGFQAISSALSTLPDGAVYFSEEGLEIPDDSGEIRSDWELLKEEKQGKEIKCPRCGTIVYRPGNASTHPCFEFAQDQVEHKLQSHIGNVDDVRPANFGCGGEAFRQRQSFDRTMLDAMERDDLPPEEGWDPESQ